MALMLPMRSRSLLMERKARNSDFYLVDAGIYKILDIADKQKFWSDLSQQFDT